MAKHNNPPVLAIGIESAEQTLVRRMIKQNDLPTLASLLSAGRWIRLESPAHIGTSSVWPTFMTGQDPAVHGIYSEWTWEPAGMSAGRFQSGHLKPFWKTLAETGHSLGIMAIPFMPFVGVTNGFEVSESEPYLPPTGNGRANRNAGANLVTRHAAHNALTHGRISVDGPEDISNLQKLAIDSVEGIKLRGKLAERLLAETRPDLSVIVFTETHESGHCLWHSVEPDHPLYDDKVIGKLHTLAPTIGQIYQEVDRAIARLIKAVGTDATVIVFGLHGMSPARGVPTFLPQLMCDHGFSHLADSANQSVTGRATELMRAVKRRMPAGLKKLYYQTLPREAVLRWATPTIMPSYDWSRTRAFSLVTEQHGSIRINLIGREEKGVVPVELYDEVCRQVEQWLWTLRTKDGQPITKHVIRTAATAQDALKHRIPDVLAHWQDAAFAEALRIEGSPHEFYPDGRRYLTQHTSEGFCIVKSSLETRVPDVLPTKKLGQLLTSFVTGATHA